MQDEPRQCARFGLSYWCRPGSEPRSPIWVSAPGANPSGRFAFRGRWFHRPSVLGGCYPEGCSPDPENLSAFEAMPHEFGAAAWKSRTRGLAIALRRLIAGFAPGPHRSLPYSETSP